MEKFISGYCRALDKGRVVTVENEDGPLTMDCAFKNCPHCQACGIAKQIAELLEKEGL
ncbi:MAG: hypothetical protein J6V34_03915 [Oscillospiraceae bacterium]|nr:hypothetical protein [Oscillospiraceae bacterium]